jgi:hypothetical protein
MPRLRRLNPSRLAQRRLLAVEVAELLRRAVHKRVAEEELRVELALAAVDVEALRLRRPQGKLPRVAEPLRRRCR